MRNGISLIIIALALVSILAGFLSGQHASHPPPTVTLHVATPAPAQAVLRRAAGSDSATDDVFAQDDVVVDRPLTSAPNWLPERLAIVVGLCGSSVAIESRFLSLDLPLAFDLDPAGVEAEKVARLVHSAGDPLFVHLDAPPTRDQLDALQARLGHVDGIAARASSGMPRALAGSGLAFFDERGDADPRAFRLARVQLIRRDVTADNRTATTYIDFMLARAADHSARAGSTVVFLRPQPNSLAALVYFTQSHTVELKKAIAINDA